MLRRWQSETNATQDLLVPQMMVPPDEVSDQHQKSTWRGWRLAGLIVLFSLLGAGILVGGFIVGQSTRDSAATVKQKLADQAAHDHAQASAALKAQSERLNDKVSRVADQARANGYSAGQSDGYSSGQSAGYQSGVSEGTAQGYTEGYGAGNVDGYSSGSYDGYTHGFDEGTCYDPYTYEYVC
jgi:flagellar biosynthesis/type III secretory pathway protein FliH